MTWKRAISKIILDLLDKKEFTASELREYDEQVLVPNFPDSNTNNESILSTLQLHAANRAKQDEFYTQLPDIEKELKHYRKHFRGKTVYCNCDDPTISNFFRYFHLNFAKLGLKRLITTCYKNRQTEMFSKHDMEAAAGLEHVGNGTEPTVFQLKEDGDFRSRECIELLKQADIVVTNPPFSLFREYIATGRIRQKICRHWEHERDNIQRFSPNQE